MDRWAVKKESGKSTAGAPGATTTSTSSAPSNPITSTSSAPGATTAGRVANGPKVTTSFLLAQCHPSWREFVAAEMERDYFPGLLQRLNAAGPFYPPAGSIFRMFSLFPLPETRAVILGQDPYHGPGQAMGLSFSVPRGVPVPPSLRNIYKEISRTIGYPSGIPRHGSLLGWARLGVLLLNATLTVAPSRAGSHGTMGWHRFTDAAIQEVSRRSADCVFILWGNDARKKLPLIDQERHLVLCSAHPSPLSAERGFFGCDHFRKANEFLESRGRGRIPWEADENDGDCSE